MRRMDRTECSVPGTETYSAQPLTAAKLKSSAANVVTAE